MSSSEREAIDSILGGMDEVRRRQEMAAPALYEACEIAVRELENYYRDGRHADLSIVLRAAKSAIRRADQG